MTPITDCVSTPAAGLYFLQNDPRTVMRHLTTLAQGVMNVIHHQPFTLCVSKLGDKPVHQPRHTTLGIALRSLTHVTTTGPASPERNEVRKREENKSKEIFNTNSKKI